MRFSPKEGGGGGGGGGGETPPLSARFTPQGPGEFLVWVSPVSSDIVVEVAAEVTVNKFMPGPRGFQERVGGGLGGPGIRSQVGAAVGGSERVSVCGSMYRGDGGWERGLGRLQLRRVGVAGAKTGPK